MIVEIRNVHFRNKGAELMLRAIVDHFRDRPDVVLTANHRVGSRAKLRELGIRPLLFVWQKRRHITPPTALAPRRLRKRLGLVHPSEVDLVLDAAGFAYGEQWGTDRAVAAARYYRELRKQGARVVLMPQSLGPFTSQPVRRTAAALFENVDLVFPRDDTAAAATKALIGDDRRVVQAPDFTPLLKGAVFDVALPGPRPAAVIPNRKMIQKAGLSRREYVAFLARVVERLSAAGFSPFMLPHATFDHGLATLVQDAVHGDLPIVVESDALRLKGVIGACDAIFSSRFHGLVSALSQGVPVLATGWSHKYKHLLSEYECPAALLDPRDDATLERAVTTLLADDRIAHTRKTLQERAEWNKTATTAMWERVEQLIAGST